MSVKQELYQGLKEAKKRIDKLKAEKNEKQDKLKECLKKRIKDKKTIVALRKKLSQLRKKLAFWIKQYEKLQKQKQAKSPLLSGYFRLGGSHEHAKTTIGGKIRVHENVSIYAEGHYRFDFSIKHHLGYEVGVELSF